MEHVQQRGLSQVSAQSVMPVAVRELAAAACLNAVCTSVLLGGDQPHVDLNSAPLPRRPFLGLRAAGVQYGDDSPN